jgi:uncharacterized protein (TIGR02217 family)
MGEFIEERLDTCVRIGAAAEDSYFVEASTTVGGSRFTSLRNGNPYREFNLDYIKTGSALALSVASLYHRTWGGFAGFRVKAWDDYTTANDGTSAYTALDSTLDLVSAGVYQLVKEYGREGIALASIGRPRRKLFKPVTGKVAIGVGGAAYPSAQWSVDTTTGIVTLAANKTGTITGISLASSAIVQAVNTLVVGESVHFSGVAGMTQINGLRGVVTARTGTQFTVSINTALFSAYTSGGTFNTRPQSGEAVTGGCEFDIPCTFDSKLGVDAIDYRNRDVSGLRVVELLNP